MRHGAYIRTGVVTGDHCVIGHATELKHTLLLNHAHAPHFNYVGDTILGNHVNLGAGVICANFRLDHREVVIQLEGSTIQNNYRMLLLSEKQDQTFFIIKMQRFIIRSSEVSVKVLNQSTASRFPFVVLISIIALQEKHLTEPS